MAKCFLADNSIYSRIRKRNAHNVSFNDPCFVLKPDSLDQFLRA